MESESTISRLESLYSAVVADVLDLMGFREQTLSPGIRPLTREVMVSGRVFTARAVEVSTIPKAPYQLEMGAIEQMKSGDVLVVDGGHHVGSAFWGELLSTACLAKGVRGVVMSACCRDLWRLEQLPFPVFGIGCRPTDSLGRIDVVEIGETVVIDQVQIASGDWILGDRDGVVVIPDRAIDDALSAAEAKQSGENSVREDLAAGMPVSEAFKKHGIL